MPDWASEIPYQIKTYAVKDACQAVSKAKRDFLQSDRKKFHEVKFRIKRAPTQSAGIPGSAISDKGIYYTISGKGLRFTESLPNKRVGAKSKSGKEVYADSRLLFEYNKWWLCVPEQVVIHPAENQGRLVAIDPGVRTFATFFSQDECGKIGNGDFSRLLRLGYHLDWLLSRLSQNRTTNRVNSKQRHRMKKAATKIRFKMKCLVDEIHWKTIDFLTSNFDVILLPHYETSKMTSKTHRSIQATSVRAMLNWSFYKFSQRLKFKAENLGKTVLRVDESYTSKTASWSGEIKEIGGARTITSKGITMDRDLNGARGIFLKALVDTPCLSEWRDCVVNDC